MGRLGAWRVSTMSRMLNLLSIIGGGSKDRQGSGLGACRIAKKQGHRLVKVRVEVSRWVLCQASVA